MTVLQEYPKRGAGSLSLRLTFSRWGAGGRWEALWRFPSEFPRQMKAGAAEGQTTWLWLPRRSWELADLPSRGEDDSASPRSSRLGISGAILPVLAVPVGVGSRSGAPPPPRPRACRATNRFLKPQGHEAQLLLPGIRPLWSWRWCGGGGCRVLPVLPPSPSPALAFASPDPLFVLAAARASRSPEEPCHSLVTAHLNQLKCNWE